MRLVIMNVIFALIPVLVITSAAPAQRSTNISPLLSSHQLRSICPTLLQKKVVTSAIHSTTRQRVYLAMGGDAERTKFSVGRCRLSQPMNFDMGICAITMQGYRTSIMATKQDIVRYQYKDCHPVPGNPFFKTCLEWIELPGLCQHKIP